MRCLLITIQPREGGEPVSQEIDVPEFVHIKAVLDTTLNHIHDIWGEARDHEIIDRHMERLP